MLYTLNCDNRNWDAFGSENNQACVHMKDVYTSPF